ncbi:MAG: hypothetical protein IKQ47_01295 [Prevotella sp.]|nr:hypothetical protein [Prevotella sp.]
MKNFKYMSLMVALLSVLTLSFTSCGDDDDVASAPVINLYEANLEHEGSEICVQADIKCPGKIATIIAEVYSADGKELKLMQPFTGNEGALEVPGFHKHVHLDGLTVAEGDLLKFTVVDQNGNSTTVQKNLTEEEDDED